MSVRHFCHIYLVIWHNILHDRVIVFDLNLKYSFLIRVYRTFDKFYDKLTSNDKGYIVMKKVPYGVIQKGKKVTIKVTSRFRRF